jgi:hypothetical protein
MAIRIDTTRQALANTYGTLGKYLGVASADPGAAAAPANEASGGSYARVATSWSAQTGGWEQGTACTLDVNAGTYTYAILCSAAAGATMIDNCEIDTTILPSAGQIVLTPAFVQT